MKKINKICPICASEFSVPYCHKDRYLTCGHKCGGIYRRKPIITNICKICSKKFISKKHPTAPQMHCSVKCSSQSNAKKATYSRTGKITKKFKKECFLCKKTFEITEARIIDGKNRGKYCSNKCRIKSWSIESLKNQMPGSYRKNAWKIYEKKCYDCDLKDERILVIHHIDGDRKNGKIKNLIPVCHNCHCIRHIDMGNDGRISSYRRYD